MENKLKGFTIIEVSLVLAIAGLIFLMIFIALPALQRQQRDTARKEDITALISTVKKFQTNNRGALPNGTGENIHKATEENYNKISWSGFLRDYMGDGFEDPSSGEEYNLYVMACGAGTTGGACPNAENVTSSTFPNDFKMYVLTEAKCSGDESTGAVKVSNPRKIAVLYKLEGGGIYCENS